MAVIEEDLRVFRAVLSEHVEGGPASFGVSMQTGVRRPVSVFVRDDTVSIRRRGAGQGGARMPGW